MDGDNGKTPNGRPKIKRFSDKVAVVSYGTLLAFGSYLISTTWQLRGDLQEVIDAERAETAAEINEARQFAEATVEKYHKDVKEDLNDLKADVRDLRTQIIKLYGRGR